MTRAERVVGIVRILGGALLAIACGPAMSQEPPFNGLVRYELCRTEALHQCIGNFCALVGTEGLPSLSLDFGESTYGVPELGEVGPMEIVGTSPAEVGKPLWIRFTFSPKFMEGRMAHAMLSLKPDPSFGGYDHTISFTSTGLAGGKEGDPPTRAVAAGRCEAK